jgi:hypothetical protein
VVFAWWTLAEEVLTSIWESVDQFTSLKYANEQLKLFAY